ncbi:alpha/beta hydrolase [Shewanella sp. Scap07]|uniref:alpha/beta hydrolase n=1 Tax=Shewanella sp. Scap07 TaxID=2589987 RepID=UPI0015B9DEED|nr:alpha/beta hydrolase-fold protein [Shewanella sp. Scap07]QLE87608.1 alpha/beta hydrolase [Shewanella sp. Scap07]
MKYVAWLVLVFICPWASAKQGFEIPRSKVVELTDPQSGRVYPLYIKLPRSYLANQDKHYPVIYLTDANYSFQLASGATRFPMNTGAMAEAIIVGISYSKGAKGPSSRVRDYTPSLASDWQLPTGNAKGHALFIRETVFTYIETHYRVNQLQRTFVGNSLGGLFGAYMLFTQPNMFSSYILGSPSVWFNNHAILTAKIAKPSKATKVYLSVGQLEQPKFGEREDMVAGAKQLAAKISMQTDNNILLKFSVIDGASHSTAFPTTLIQGLDWLYGVN